MGTEALTEILSWLFLALGCTCLVGTPILLLLAYYKRRREFRRALRAELKDEIQVTGSWSKSDMIKFVRRVLGPDARYDETPTEADPRRVYAIVSHPKHHRVISCFDLIRDAQAGRRRMVQRLSDPDFLAETRK